MSTAVHASPQQEKLKVRSWRALAVGTGLCLIPYVGFSMWFLAIPLLLYTAVNGFRVLKSGDRDGGLLVIGASIFVAPVAFFILPFCSAGLVEVMTGKLQQATSATTSNATIEYWTKMREIEKSANDGVKKDPRDYPMTESGQYDFPKFVNEDYEALSKYYYAEGITEQKVAVDIGSLAILGVDQELVSYKTDLCEHWSSSARVFLGWAELVNCLHQQSIKFTNGGASTLRLAKALLGQADMEIQYQSNQQEIDSKLKSWNLLRAQDNMLRERIQKRELEIKALLTSRHNWEFQ